MVGIGIGLRITGGTGTGSAGGLRASSNRYATGASPGTVLATLTQPFGAATSYTAVGAPAQLALTSGGRIVAATGASVGGQSYAIKIRAASADGAREIAETFTLLAQGAAAALSALTLGTTGATAGAAWSATIVGLTAGSNVAASASDGTMLNVNQGIVSGVFATAGSKIVTLTETLAGAVGNPRASTVAVTVAAAAQAQIALNTPLITIGPSIQNVVNTRSPRMWLMAHAKGHFAPTPGTNAAIGAACATLEGAQKQGLAGNYYREPTVRLPFVLNQLGDPAARGRVLVQYDPGPNDLADIAGDGSTTYGVTAAKLIAAMDAWIKDVVTDCGHMIALCAIAISGSSATNTHAAAIRTAYNQAAAQRHDPATGVFYCGSRLTAFDGYNEGGLTWTSLTYDGTLHPNARGADLIGLADHADLAPHFAAGHVLRTGGTPFGQAANSLWNMGGTTGTASTGTSGTVAAGWTVACSTSATGVGTAIGIIATCASSGTRDFVVNGQTLALPCQQIDVVGTPSADGFLRFEASAGVVKGTGAAQYFNTGEFGQAILAVEVLGSMQADPAGVASMGFQYGLLGGAMNKTVDTNTGTLAKARQLVLRTVPGVSLKLNGAQKPEFALGFKSGVAVNVRVYLACLDCAQVETVAYAAPYNLSTAFVPAGATNPLATTTKPSLSGTFTAGATLPIAAPTVSGGGAGLYGATSIRDAGNTVLSTIANAATTYSWVSAGADSGKTVRASVTAANGYGAATIEGPAYAIA